MVPLYDFGDKEAHSGEETGILKDRAGGIVTNLS